MRIGQYQIWLLQLCSLPHNGMNIAKLQRAQNALARVVTNTRRTEHIRPVLKDLHWLPINYRIDYKLAILTYKIRATCSPAYLKPFIRDYVPSRQLRSSSMQLIMTEATKTEIARRSFSQAAPSVWNCLPYEIRAAETIERFRTSRRTHLHRTAFNNWSRDCSAPTIRRSYVDIMER